LIETPKSWFDAQSYCRERGYDLATIDDMGAMKSLLGLSADKAHDELWIGLHYGGHKEWRWSLADKDFYQEGGRKYRNFEGSSNAEMFVRQHKVQGISIFSSSQLREMNTCFSTLRWRNIWRESRE
jgi:hypothetical protein